MDQNSPSSSEKQKRWILGTPRGDVKCSYVVHATNAYSGYLLPFMADRHPSKMCSKARGTSTTEKGLPGAESIPFGASPKSRTAWTGANGDSLQTPQRPIQPLPKVDTLPPLKAHTIVPTRGQVGAVRATVNASALAWLNAWDGGGGGWEYWFPRYQGTNSSVNPLIIFGGGREHSGGRLEAGVVDDAVLNPSVSTALHEFLPSVFPGKFAADGGWEMEWVRRGAVPPARFD